MNKNLRSIIFLAALLFTNGILLSSACASEPERELCTCKVGQPKSEKEIASCYYNNAMFYNKQKQYQKAIDSINIAIALNPQKACYYNDRGIMYSKIKNYQEALRDYNKAIELDPKNYNFYSNRGILYLHELHQYKKAYRDWIKATELY